jgi:hypothetical protein
LFDDIRVEPATFRAFKADQVIQLAPKTLKLLLFLIENRGRLIGNRGAPDWSASVPLAIGAAETIALQSSASSKMPTWFANCSLIPGWKLTRRRFGFLWLR